MSSIPNPSLYDTAKALLNAYFSTLYDFTVSGFEQVPASGPLVFAANHVSFYDPPVIGCRIPRRINYFARDTLFRGLFGTALLRIGTIPVARQNAEVKSLKAIFKALKADGAVAIYPEGTRSPDGQLAEPKPGAGMIACKSGASIIPTRVFGTYEAFGRHRKFPKIGGRLHVTYGPPVAAADLDPGKEHSERYLETSRRIMSRIAALRQPEDLAV